MGPEGSVAAVVPTHRAPEGRLHAAVASLLALPLVGRVVVVDDGSEPPASVVEDARVAVVRQRNAGPSAARNRGLEALRPLREEWVVFLDDDDEALPGLGAEADLATRLGAAAAVGARVAVGPGGCRRLHAPPPEWADATLPHAADVFRPILLFSTSGTLVHRRVVEAGVRFDEGLFIGEDRDFLRRAGEVGPIAVCSSPVVRQRVEAAGRLTSPGRLARRARDHAVILERHLEARSAAHLREATRWLLNAAARERNDEAWAVLAAEARRRGWGVPLRARARRLVRAIAPPGPGKGVGGG